MNSFKIVEGENTCKSKWDRSCYYKIEHIILAGTYNLHEEEKKREKSNKQKRNSIEAQKRTTWS
jgi:hypothetical protein